MRIPLSRHTNTFYMSDTISIGPFIIVLRFHILLRKFKQQSSSFLFSIRQDCTYRWMQVHPSMYLDSISDWEIPQAMQGDQKNKQKLCDLESVHPFAELKRSTVLSRGLYLQLSQEVVFQLLWWSVTDSLFSLWIKMEF